MSGHVQTCLNLNLSKSGFQCMIFLQKGCESAAHSVAQRDTKKKTNRICQIRSFAYFCIMHDRLIKENVFCYIFKDILSQK